MQIQSWDMDQLFSSRCTWIWGWWGCPTGMEWYQSAGCFQGVCTVKSAKSIRLLWEVIDTFIQHVLHPQSKIYEEARLYAYIQVHWQIPNNLVLKCMQQTKGFKICFFPSAQADLIVCIVCVPSDYPYAQLLNITHCCALRGTITWRV